MYQIFFALAINSQEAINGIVVANNIFFLPYLSVNGPVSKEDSGRAIVTKLAEIRLSV
jgi:hypothetical protein